MDLLIMWSCMFAVKDNMGDILKMKICTNPQRPKKVNYNIYTKFCRLVFFSPLCFHALFFKTTSANAERTHSPDTLLFCLSLSLTSHKQHSRATACFNPGVGRGTKEKARKSKGARRKQLQRKRVRRRREGKLEEGKKGEESLKVCAVI